MKALTKEEKRAKAAARAKQKAELKKKFPGFSYHSDDFSVFLGLGAGDCESLEIEVKVSGDEWLTTPITLDNIKTLAELVHALTARLNNLIEEANQITAKCRPVPLEKVPPE